MKKSTSSHNVNSVSHKVSHLKEKSDYGGVLRNTRRGRKGPRKLTTKFSMHMVLRSSKARKDWSFTKPKNKKRIRELLNKHAHKNYIRILSVANVGNHLHLHLRLLHKDSYKPFIRAITGAIALFVTGANRFNALVKNHSDRFWDYRPYTIFVDTFRHFLNMKDYMRINQLEGVGYSRLDARMILAYEYDRKFTWPDDS